ncbi:hypothetical protein ACEQ8H_001396 [Pleosporales sp. CAS-2024a]
MELGKREGQNAGVDNISNDLKDAQNLFGQVQFAEITVSGTVIPLHSSLSEDCTIHALSHADEHTKQELKRELSEQERVFLVLVEEDESREGETESVRVFERQSFPKRRQ